MRHVHRARRALIAIAALVVLAGCAPEPTPVAAALLEDEVTFEVLAIENLDGSYVTGGTVRNHSDLLYSLHFEIDYYDRRGRVVGTHPSAMFDLYPGVEHAFFAITADDWSHADHAEVRVTHIVKEEQTAIRPDLVFGNLSVYNHAHGSRVFGEVTNRGAEQVSLIVLGAIVDEQGGRERLVKSNIEGVDGLRPGEMRMFVVDMIGQVGEGTQARAYVSSITDVAVVPQRVPDISFSDLQLTYHPDADRTGLRWTMRNRDDRAWSAVILLIGVYDQDRLVHVVWTSIPRIEALQTLELDRRLFDGGLHDLNPRIHVKSFRAIE